MRFGMCQSHPRGAGGAVTGRESQVICAPPCQPLCPHTPKACDCVHHFPVSHLSLSASHFAFAFCTRRIHHMPQTRQVDAMTRMTVCPPPPVLHRFGRALFQGCPTPMIASRMPSTRTHPTCQTPVIHSGVDLSSLSGARRPLKTLHECHDDTPAPL